MDSMETKGTDDQNLFRKRLRIVSYLESPEPGDMENNILWSIGVGFFTDQRFGSDRQSSGIKDYRKRKKMKLLVPTVILPIQGHPVRMIPESTFFAV